MSRQQTLESLIVIKGHVDNSFGVIGETLLGLGSQIDALNSKIIDFGKDSFEQYVKYDDIMREVQALGEYDNKTIASLDAYNKSIAQTSRYTMEQAAQAEVLMAQLGLDINQTKTLMPTVTGLATAANIDLADSLDYLYYSLNSLNLPMEYANTLSDQMSKTAAISAADIDTLGQSLQRLGSGAQFFAGGSDEILAILGGISQFGTDMQGSNAGTQLRNFMLTLLAPTQGKQKLLDTLAITETEWSEFESYMDDAGIDLTTTAAAMDELGFSVYDASGNLKPAIQIIEELDAALASLPESEKNAMLGNLFGKRTTTTALNLIKSLSTIIDYQKQIENESAGYTNTMAEIMEGGPGGAIRELQAAYDALKTTVGESASGPIERIADGLTNIINTVANFDEPTMNGLVAGMAGVGATGPALLAAGGALRLIGYLFTPGGAIALGVPILVALTAGVVSFASTLAEQKFESHFGDLDLDVETLNTHVNALATAFADSYSEINAYSTALDTAVASYTTASQTLSSDLLTKAITGATLSDDDKANLASLGDTMGTELLTAISASFDKSASYLTMLFGGAGTAEYDEDYQGAIMLANAMYEDLVGQAEQIGREFGETLGAAMDDGIITGDEYNAVMEKMQAYNDAMALAQQADQASELAKQLHKAQSVSWDSAESFLADSAATMNEKLEEAALIHEGEKAKWGVYYDDAIEKGLINPITGSAYTDDDKAAFMADLEGRYEAKRQGYIDQNAQVTLATYDALMSQSDYGDAWAFLKSVYAQGPLERDEYGNIKEGQIDWNALFPDGRPMLGEDNALYDQLYDLWRGEHGISGVGDKLTSILGPYMDNAQVAQIPQMLDDILQIMDYTYAYDAGTAHDIVDMDRSGMSDFFMRLGEGIESGSTEGLSNMWKGLSEFAQGNVKDLTERLGEVYDYEKVLAEMGGPFASADNPFREYAAAYQLMYGGLDADNYLIKAQVEPVVADGAIQEAAGDQQIQADVEPGIGENAIQEAAGDQQISVDVVPEVTPAPGPAPAPAPTPAPTSAMEVPVEITGGSEAAAAELAEAQSVMDAGVTAEGDVTGLYGSAVAERNSAQAYLNANPGSWTVHTRQVGGVGMAGKGSRLSLFAEGGRATEASIFGEDGPEWAIPEEHTERVANLLNMAREGAGFTWPELLSRNGGLNAGGGGSRTLVYSPTIIANDATGVEEKLKEDKERLEEWYREKQLHDEIEVYA